MAEISGFHNSKNGDRKYKAKFFAEYFASFIANGVFPNPSTGCQVIFNGDMTITVNTGKAWINGLYYHNDSDLILPIEVADGVLKRIDRIVLQYSAIDRTITANVKKGAFASTPNAPALQRDADAYEIGLADIYIAAGATSISQANITDLRFNNTHCGIVHGVVDQIDTTGLFTQYNAEFNEWFTTVVNTLDADAAGNLLNMINAINVILTPHVSNEEIHNKYTDKGIDPEFAGAKYKLVVIDGEPFLEVVSV